MYIMHYVKMYRNLAKVNCCFIVISILNIDRRLWATEIVVTGAQHPTPRQDCNYCLAPRHLVGCPCCLATPRPKEKEIRKIEITYLVPTCGHLDASSSPSFRSNLNNSGQNPTYFAQNGVKQYPNCLVNDSPSIRKKGGADEGRKGLLMQNRRKIRVSGGDLRCHLEFGDKFRIL